MNDLEPATDDLLRRIQQARREISESGETVDQAERRAASENLRRMGRDRSWISIAIIATYALTIIGAVIYLLVTSPGCEDGNTSVCGPLLASWESQVARLQDLIVTTVLPIVTLMLGFYFGTETSRGNSENS